jgi:ribosomal-protein-alanine N-acetyltransferase
MIELRHAARGAHVTEGLRMTKDAQPTLGSERLVLRPFEAADGPMVRALAGREEVAATTLLIPHPYPQGAAEAWIGTHAAQYERGDGATFAITLREDGRLVGAIGLTISAGHNQAELGYWIGVEDWGRGYATEAGRRLLAFGFDDLELDRIHAHHFSDNPASGRVLRKIGMSFEGMLRKHIRKWGRRRDLPMYAVLRDEFETARRAGVADPTFEGPVPRPIVVPEIATDRLVLRALQRNDAESLSRICDEPIFARGHGGIELPYTPERAQRSIEGAIREADAGTAAVFGITLPDTGELIGRMSIARIRREHRRGSMSLLLAREQWGNGYATEALRALIEYAFHELQMNRLDACCFTWNAPSLRLIERCGLRQEGFKRQADFVDGEWYDDLLFGLLRADYEAVSSSGR